MNIKGPWYGRIMVAELLEGEEATFSIVDSGGAVEEVHARPISGPPDFRAWLTENESLLIDGLGLGMYRGIWWGHGIGRGYGAPGRQLALYAPDIWSSEEPEALNDIADHMAHAPVLYSGPFVPSNGVDPVAEALRRLQYSGSAAGSGYKPAAGVVVTNIDANVSFSVEL